MSKERLGLGDRTTKLCDGDCGRVYYTTDLSLNCYNDYMCNNCMFDFIAEQERGKVYDAVTGEE